jgi:beta-mannosidase
LGKFQISGNLEDKFFFLVAELKRPDGRLVSRSVYWPRCLKLMEEPEFRKKYREAAQPSLIFEHGPWLKPQVAATRTTLELSVVSQHDLEQNQSRLQLRVRNTGSKPAFLTQLDIKGTKRAFYGSDNFFWLAPGEMRSLDLRVLWRDPATRDRAVLTVHAWNAPATQVTFPRR